MIKTLQTKSLKLKMLWRSRSLNLEGKITVFKSLALSKIIHLALVKTIPNTTVEELNKIQKNFI